MKEVSAFRHAVLSRYRSLLFGPSATPTASASHNEVSCPVGREIEAFKCLEVPILYNAAFKSGEFPVDGLDLRCATSRVLAAVNEAP